MTQRLAPGTLGWWVAMFKRFRREGIDDEGISVAPRTRHYRDTEDYFFREIGRVYVTQLDEEERR
jgi:hypothetical protein